MLLREKFFLTVLMIFAAVSFGGVTLSRRTQQKNELFAALPFVFVGSVTAIFSSKKKLGSLTVSKHKKRRRSSAAGVSDFQPNVRWDFLNDMSSELPVIDTEISCESVLIVASTEADLEIIKDMLRPYRMRIDCVDNSQSAVELIAAEDFKYDTIFIDYLMPDIDGFDTVSLIRGLATDYAQSVPIIAVSPDKTACEDAFIEKGFQAFVAKSVDAMELKYIINRWVRGVDCLTPEGHTTANTAA